MPKRETVAGRRETYFAFQGLLTAVLMLLFLRQYPVGEEGLKRFLLLLSISGAALAFVRLAPEWFLPRWWFQAGLFLGDIGLASLILGWTQTQSQLYLIYFLIIFGTALTRSLFQSFFVAVITTGLFIASYWDPVHGLPESQEFWLKLLFLWVSSALLAILSRDFAQAQADQERKYDEKVIQIERLAALGQLAGEVAHRIKGPLTTILVNAEVLSNRFRRSEAALRELGQIQEEVKRCREILRDLLNLGRLEEIDFRVVDLRSPIRSAVKSIEAQANERGVRINLTGLEGPANVQGDQSLLHEAIVVVLQNSLEAAKPDGLIQINLSKEDAKPWRPRDSGAFRLAIEDDGRGIDPRDMERIFQPFFTTKGAEGNGLGLSAAQRIVQKHDGSIEAESLGSGLGARFTITLPTARRRRRA